MFHLGRGLRRAPPHLPCRSVRGSEPDLDSEGRYTKHTCTATIQSSKHATGSASIWQCRCSPARNLAARNGALTVCCKREGGVLYCRSLALCTCAIEADPSGFSRSIHSNTSPRSLTPSCSCSSVRTSSAGIGGTASCSLRSHAQVPSGTKSLLAPTNCPACTGAQPW